jgi:hypothetical protein
MALNTMTTCKIELMAFAINNFLVIIFYVICPVISMLCSWEKQLFLLVQLENIIK